MGKPVDFDAVNRTALDNLPALCRRWLPDGRREGSEWVVGSLRGERGRSLKIRLTGPKAGVWRDFAEGIGGSDAVNIAAALGDRSLPSLKIGKRRLIRVEAVKAWIAAHEAKSNKGGV